MGRNQLSGKVSYSSNVFCLFLYRVPRKNPAVQVTVDEYLDSKETVCTRGDEERGRSYWLAVLEVMHAYNIFTDVDLCPIR